MQQLWRAAGALQQVLLTFPGKPAFPAIRDLARHLLCLDRLESEESQVEQSGIAARLNHAG
ncbi:hypothetical protein J1C56_27800 [Aminobacter anthyllidis]|uniref:Uncharacterized protein n=1 Tax=Aminobacter anthyllidis TaxID=1035067 RepID=A0A9X1AGC2_9HYPH|nr:hypothetical protein [Aminobacter anthyllidis]MBT1159380.1 hypothetical protein [Aminobacter anthyllidis]